MPFKLTPAPPVLYRIGYLPDPFTWRPPRTGPLKDPDSAEAASEGARFDDPLGTFPTLYFAESALTAFVEIIADFRPAPGLRDKILAATDEEEPDAGHDPELADGRLPRGFFEPPDRGSSRTLATCCLAADASLIDVSDPATHVELNSALARAVTQFGIDRFDRGVMMTQDRRVTRTVAGHVFDATSEAVGIRFESRFVPDGWCIALWNRVALVDMQTTPISNHHPDLLAAAELLGITLES